MFQTLILDEKSIEVELKKSTLKCLIKEQGQISAQVGMFSEINNCRGPNKCIVDF